MSIAMRPDLVTGPVQRLPGASTPGAQDVHAAAARGIATASSSLPYGDVIQRSFGHHDIGSLRAHTDPAASASAAAMGAEAYATGNHVVLGGSPSLHTVAHEAAHVIQQRGGVHLKGGVGQAGDEYERHADAVAERVVQGRSAAALLDVHAGGSGGSGVQAKAGPVQRKEAVDFDPVVAARHHPKLAAYLAELEAAYRENRTPAVDDISHLPELIASLNAADPGLRLEYHNFIRIHSPCPVVKVGEKSELIVVEEQYGSTTKAAIRTNYSSPGTATLPVQRRAQA